ncbi:MAG TPA: hypothetical protein VEH84_08655 [Alphaproteobacteria bacterium]|nr:hypothetical protein [Alphaproteobacteria bacterium]
MVGRMVAMVALLFGTAPALAQNAAAGGGNLVLGGAALPQAGALVGDPLQGRGALAGPMALAQGAQMPLAGDFSLGLGAMGDGGALRPGMALNLSYGTRLSPDVTLNLGPTLTLPGEQPALVPTERSDGDLGLAMQFNWQIADGMGLTGLAGASQGDDFADRGTNYYTGLSFGLRF